MPMYSCWYSFHQSVYAHEVEAECARAKALGIEVVGERSLEKDLIAVGEKVHVLIYRLYIFDEEKTYLMENSEMQEQDVFYI